MADTISRVSSELQICPEDLENIPHCAFDVERGGGWENDLTAIFERHLGPNLGREN
jgi:predicted RNA-binding protein